MLGDGFNRIGDLGAGGAQGPDNLGPRRAAVTEQGLDAAHAALATRTTPLPTNLPTLIAAAVTGGADSKATTEGTTPAVRISPTSSRA